MSGGRARPAGCGRGALRVVWTLLGAAHSRVVDFAGSARGLYWDPRFRKSLLNQKPKVKYPVDSTGTHTSTKTKYLFE
jgi:hypothetical protein